MKWGAHRMVRALEIVLFAKVRKGSATDPITLLERADILALLHAVGRATIVAAMLAILAVVRTADGDAIAVGAYVAVPAITSFISESMAAMGGGLDGHQRHCEQGEGGNQ